MSQLIKKGPKHTLELGKDRSDDIYIKVWDHTAEETPSQTGGDTERIFVLNISSSFLGIPFFTVEKIIEIAKKYDIELDPKEVQRILKAGHWIDFSSQSDTE